MDRMCSILLTPAALAAAVVRQTKINGVNAEDLLQYLMQYTEREIDFGDVGFKLPSLKMVIVELKILRQGRSSEAESYATHERRLQAHEDEILERLTGEDENIGNEQIY